MQRTSLAPELSATLKTRLLLDHRARSVISTRRQRFQLRERTGLLYPDPVADGDSVLFVMDVEPLGAKHGL